MIVHISIEVMRDNFYEIAPKLSGVMWLCYFFTSKLFCSAFQFFCSKDLKLGECKDLCLDFVLSNITEDEKNKELRVRQDYDRQGYEYSSRNIRMSSGHVRDT